MHEKKKWNIIAVLWGLSRQIYGSEFFSENQKLFRLFFSFFSFHFSCANSGEYQVLSAYVNILWDIKPCFAYDAKLDANKAKEINFFVSWRRNWNYFLINLRFLVGNRGRIWEWWNGKNFEGFNAKCWRVWWITKNHNQQN